MPLGHASRQNGDHVGLFGSDAEHEAGSSDQDVVESALAATIEVRSRSGLGSGFLLEKSGLAVTARHVVEERNRSAREVKVRVFLPDRQTLDTTATVFSSHRRLDYALLWLKEPGPYPALHAGHPEQLRPPDVVFALGSPSGLSNTVSRGIVGSPCRSLGDVEYIQTDAAISEGNSGGPMIDRLGRAVGINLMGLTSEHGSVDAARFALPMDYIWTDVKKALDLGKEHYLCSFYCRSCGHTEYERPAWYCRTCGVKTHGSHAPRRARSRGIA
jgi:S1-C subfamily serine protease